MHIKRLYVKKVVRHNIFAFVNNPPGALVFDHCRAGEAGLPGACIFSANQGWKNNRDFKLFKFRTMYVDADKKGLLTVGHRDSRITRVGYNLRRYKLDELPQLFNVLIGDMSVVGPRPEVRKYVDMYDERQQKVVSVRPGITDFASIRYVNENELLKNTENPEKLYIDEIMPAKLELNLKYIENRHFFKDLKIILLTVKAIFT